MKGTSNYCRVIHIQTLSMGLGKKQQTVNKENAKGLLTGGLKAVITAMLRVT
jgi:hypothetical protein